MTLPARVRRRVSRQLLASLALVLAMVIWGSAFTVTKAALAEVPPFTLAFLRFLVAVAVMAPFAVWGRRHGRTGSALPVRKLALMGLTGITLEYGAYNLGIAHTSVTNAALIHGTVPAATFVASAWFLRERVGWKQAVGTAGSIAGVALIVLAGAGAAGAELSLFGDAMMVVTVVAWVAYTLLGKSVAASQSGLTSTAVSNLFGLVFLTPFAAYEVLNGALTVYSAPAWTAVIYLGVMSSAVGLFLWNFSLSQVSAGQAGAFVNIEPVVAVAVAVVFLGETVAIGQVAGGALVLAGVFLVNRGPR